MDCKPTRIFKTNFKRQKTLLKNNETIYHDKVPISTRFYLQLLKRSQFLDHFLETETYEYASENEKALNSPEVKTKSSSQKKEAEKSSYNLRSTESKTERKIFYQKTRAQKKRNAIKPENVELKANVRKRNPKEPLAPIIEEIKKREPLKSNGKGGSEIDKIAEKLKNLVKTNANEKLDKELLTCRETFEKENVDADMQERDGESVEMGKLLRLYELS